MHHFRQLHKNLDRTDKDSDIERIHGKICHLHLTLRDQPAAKYKRHQIHQPLKEQVAAHKRPHAAIIGVLGFQKIFIAVAEFLTLNFFIGKGLHNTDSRQCVLQARVDITDLLPVIHKGCLHPFVLSIRKQDHEKYEYQKWDSKPSIDQKQKHKRAYDLNQ